MESEEEVEQVESEEMDEIEEKVTIGGADSTFLSHFSPFFSFVLPSGDRTC